MPQDGGGRRRQVPIPTHPNTYSNIEIAKADMIGLTGVGMASGGIGRLG